MTQAADAMRCPWCSAETVAGRPNCPSCGANLVETGEPAVPGLTAIDAEAVLRSVRAATTAPRRNRFLSLITGEDLDEVPAVPGSPAALAPPAPDVRREMLRMEIAAELADATAEAEALIAEGADDRAPGDATGPAVPEAGAPADEPSGEPVGDDRPEGQPEA
ncbi:MAG TPA: hypothetical protein VGK63_04940 [Candidatus Limnocylindrales bacterium]